MKAQKNLIYGLVLAALLFWTAAPASGIILHADGEPNLLTWTERPNDNVIGRWGSCSCVAISSDCIISTQHQDDDNINTPVNIGGTTYTISQIWPHGTADLQIAKLNGANLLHFVDIYDDVNEVGKNVVFGGYGMSRGAELKTGGITYGYEWDSSGDGILRFGTNKVVSTRDSFALEGFVSKAFIAYFDGLNEGDSTEYESAFATYDSGGGAFIQDGDSWKAAGLCEAVEAHDGQTWFRDCNDPNEPDPDFLWSVRLSSYVTWIYQTMPERMSGELTGDDLVDFNDFDVFTSYWLHTDCHAPDWCQGCDFEPDGDVDFADFAVFACFWPQEDPPP